MINILLFYPSGNRDGHRGNANHRQLDCPQTKDFAAEDVAGQTEQVMKNMGAILEAAGSSFSKVVKTTILLADMDDFATVNQVYGKYFPENPPARATFAVKGLPLGAKVEIDAVALE